MQYNFTHILYSLEYLYYRVKVKVFKRSLVIYRNLGYKEKALQLQE
jgi:hypothetical protein